ncbi:MAG: phosphoribosylformylglycinamidine synthase subunit PurQ [Candidatus Omnitrophica bacterium]|nr:phosphoribosylformylglycinamidine synthase subunit PurQ [Candidatus Omnitrophota bacterium]MBU0878901.1 phosphoribosylformylglycinamidine synthase subunit PurQ [Candidatus Omnitrophota bacterium]MBU0896011.1 phosphoribosylformylglycinamidine synthase subunit PurQ [Candidatus Omnitrophota bacterium]MBU1133564.1 phosphoribosylformylglycinamidine synthase subunit PurQ [Candidatus Omnitrophota bacterium]MBU1367261.1 phosphoribosylformylglycinamidine synthase subunit PurQ [Candidatus Omnitrophota
MKFGVVVFPGSNCEEDCFYVIKEILAQPAERIWHKQTALDNFDCIVLPGGFSYGDYLRTGAIARFSPIMKPLVDFAHKGGIVIGICNGFQILLESGLLPGAMLRNKELHFICKYVHIKTENINTLFTNLCSSSQVLKIPIAHNEGNYYIDEQGLKSLEKNRQIVFRYCSPKGEINKEFNPNGAIANIAGIVNKEGNILGMMPHPERSSEIELGSEDGRLIFKSILKWTESK